MDGDADRLVYFYLDKGKCGSVNGFEVPYPHPVKNVVVLRLRLHEY